MLDDYPCCFIDFLFPFFGFDRIYQIAFLDVIDEGFVPISEDFSPSFTKKILGFG